MENDIVSVPIGIKVAYIEPEKQKSYLRRVEQEFISEKKDTCLIFRGSNEPIFDRTEIDNIIYLGEPISIADPVGIDIGKRRRNNLLIIGENQKMLDRIINLCIKEILLMKKEDEIKSLYVFDGAEMIDEAGSIVPIVQNEKAVEHVTNVFCVIPAIERLYAIYSERKRNMAEGKKCEKDKQKIFVVFSNYQWIEPLSRMMENKSVTEFMSGEEKQGSTLDDLMTSFKTMTPNNKLRVLLESGYLCRIHITMSCNDYSYIKKILSTELSPFTNRIALKTVLNVMYSLINTDISTKYMRDNTALFSDGVTEPYLFKPYRMEV